MYFKVSGGKMYFKQKNRQKVSRLRRESSERNLLFVHTNLTKASRKQLQQLIDTCRANFPAFLSHKVQALIKSLPEVKYRRILCSRQRFSMSNLVRRELRIGVRGSHSVINFYLKYIFCLKYIFFGGVCILRKCMCILKQPWCNLSFMVN